jgi:hypothetical protein
MKSFLIPKDMVRLNHRYKDKRYISPYNGTRRPREGVEIQLYFFFNLDVRWGGRPTPRLGRFFPGKDGTYCIGGWVGPGPVWTGAENLVPTGIRSSLYRLNYPGPFFMLLIGNMLSYGFEVSRILQSGRRCGKLSSTLPELQLDFGTATKTRKTIN